jgi:hypothetical protein
MQLQYSTDNNFGGGGGGGGGGWALEEMSCVLLNTPSILKPRY